MTAYNKERCLPVWLNYDLFSYPIQCELSHLEYLNPSLADFIWYNSCNIMHALMILVINMEDTLSTRKMTGHTNNLDITNRFEHI